MGHGRTLEYPKTSTNTVKRYNQRATYDLEEIHGIINACTVVHVSFNTPPETHNPFPVCLPMVGVAASYEHPSAGLDEPLDVYLHGYVSSRLMNLSRQGEGSAAADGAAPTPAGLPVTVSATKVDGLILSLTPNTHDINYRSATVFGYATIVEDVEEKVWAMEHITNSVLTDRWRHTRVPPDAAEMQSTSILRVKVVGGSGKVRVGGPKDETKDMKREDLKQVVWTGVVPVWEQLGEPVAGNDNLVKAVPDHVLGYVSAVGGANEKYAKNALVEADD